MCTNAAISHFIFMSFISSLITTPAKVVTIADKKDEKTQTKLSHGIKGKVGKLNPIKTRLVFNSVLTSAANTVLNTAVAVDPSQSTEWSSFVNIFDEAKVTGGTVYFRITPGGAPANGTAEAILTYDPLDNSVYSSVDGALVASQHTGVLSVLPLGSSAATSGTPLPYTKTGNWTFRFKVPKSPQKVANATAADQENAAGNWISTNKSITPNFGWIKPFISIFGGTGTSVLDMHIVMEVSFRSRT